MAFPRKPVFHPAVKTALKTFPAFLLILLFPLNVAMADQRTIPIEEAYGLALASHEAVRIAGEAVEQAKSTVGKATSVMLPQVSAEGNYTRYSEKKTEGGFLLQPE